MTRFVVEDDVWAIFPHAKIGVVVAQGIDNGIKNASVYEQMLRTNKCCERRRKRRGNSWSLKN
ncbi:hypothetical protein [Geobacillus thermoleovorans]|uniref:hypothetical protein n=1 Tax=Geobacillus thermoleovorans TaxID=33941 RepID=UPI003D328E0B